MPTYLTASPLAYIVAPAFSISFAACSNGDGSSLNTNAASTDEEQIRLVLTNFYEEAYNSGRNLNAAYALFDSSTMETCAIDKFERIAEFARAFTTSTGLSVEAVRDIRVSGSTASATVELSRRTMPPFFPGHVTLRKEHGQWRYVVTSDPSCESTFAFFQLDPGAEVTTEAQADPACESAYPVFCIPHSPPDLDCADIDGNKPFIAFAPDPHDFDTDDDGFGCEDNQPEEHPD